MQEIKTFEQKKKYKALRPRKVRLTERHATTIHGETVEPRVATEGPNRKEMREARQALHPGNSKSPAMTRRAKRRQKNKVAKVARRSGR